MAVDGEDPAGAALPLSIGGRVADEEGGPYESAVNCAAALDITGESLMQRTNNTSSAEIQLLKRAEAHFKARAEQTRAADGESTSTVAIARRRSEKANDTSQQAQLAIACLRRFGDEIGA